MYNLAFHYSNMVQAYIIAGRVDLVKYCYDKFKFYANDIYKNAEMNPGLYFVVDTLTFELRKCQVLIHEKNERGQEACSSNSRKCSSWSHSTESQP